MDLATPPHASSSAFCMAIQRPIMTSMTESIDSPRRGRRSTRSHSAPSAIPTAMAAGIAATNGRPRTASVANAAYAPSV